MDQRPSGFLDQAPERPRRWKSFRRELTDEQRRDILGQLYAEGDDRLPFLRRFAILLSLSVLIAVFGLASDSGPVVIGAMLVSPLTTPLLGLSGALVMGWPRRALESLAILVAGTLWAFVLAYVTLTFIPEPAAITLQSEELLARTQPRMLDMAVAVVAGAAGAYVLVRREAVGALPGVAIAVALVPPLSTVGMLVELGKPDLADDALLLYVTNLAGIVFAGALVLLAAGMRPETHDGRLPRRAKAGIALAAVLVALIAYPLWDVTRHSLAHALDHDEAAAIATEWADDAGLRVQDVEVALHSARIEVVGPDPPPPAQGLADRLAVAFEQEIDLQLDWIPERRTTATGRAP
ncbi:MAG: DUF389 domain-containing protein [Solirubrobacterales bacterium]|mgnify:CR=1 FL=1|nr:DUF389 domain-containing protein [Solirubrobacterales bacterium]